MACSLDKIKSDSLRAVRKKIKGKADTVSFTKTGDALITPSKTSAKVKTKANALRMAQQKIETIDKWSKDTFGTDAYKGQWLSMTEGPNDYRLAITFPASLESHYQAKIARDEARAVQQVDAERAGQQYSDDYLFDDLVGSEEGYNYGLYLENKEKLRDYFNQRINVLTEMSNKTKKHFEQIAEFKEIVRRLNQDIVHLKSDEQILTNYFNYFQRDIETIKEILLNNPTLDNMMGARQFIDKMKFIDNTNTEKGSKKFADTFYQDLEKPIQDLFQTFINELETVDKSLTRKELDYVEQHLNNQKKGQNKENESEDKDAKDISDDIGQISSLAAFLLPIDGDTNASPLQVFVRKVYDDAVGKKETYNLRQKLYNIKQELQKVLLDKGYDNKKGVLGNLYSKVNFDVFKRKSKGGRNRIAGKFSNKWTDLKNKTQSSLDGIQRLVYKPNKDTEDFNKIAQQRRNVFDNLKANNVKFIDVRYIPEFANNTDLASNFGNFFKESAEAEAYKEEIIQSLIGTSGNRKIAEKVYNDIVEEQLIKLYDFEIKLEQYSKLLLKKNGVTNVQELPDKDRNNLLSMYYTNSPFAFAENHEVSGTSNVRKVYYQDGQRRESTDVHTLEHVSYLPTQQEHFDEAFEQDIASDETMYKAWEMFEEALKYINRNRKYASRYNEEEFDDSLTHQLDVIQKHNTSMLRLTKHFFSEVRDRIQSVISTAKYVDKVNMKMQGSIRSLDEVINTKMKPIMAVFNSANLIPFKQYKKADIKPELVKFYEKRFNQPFPETFMVGNLKEMVEKEVLDEQNYDLIDTLTSQLEIVEKFKAEKEIENKLLFVRNQIKRVDESKNPVENEHAIGLVESFIAKHLYKQNNRANWRGGQQNSKYWVKVFNKQEREMRAEVKKSIKAIEKLTENADKKTKAQAQKDIDELNKFLDSGGRVVTTGSVFEAGLIRLNILVGLGLNMTSQLKNWSIGNLALRQNDGLEWTEGNGMVAASYMRKWKIIRRKGSAKQRARYRLTNTFIDNLGIFQNSANEFEKIKESNYHNKLLKYVSNPLHIVGEMEKTIQRPQILALMGDIRITGKNGEIAPAFDVNDTTDPHPAFQLDSQGNLTLKEEFDTPENRATWIDRNSQEYADMFGESGAFPQMIARINGDYRSTSTTQIKETSVGSLAMMFKTWLPAFVLRRYGKKDGVISNLISEGKQNEAMIATSLTATMYMGIGAGILFSPMLMPVMALGVMGYKKRQQLIAKDITSLTDIMNELKKTQTYMQFLVDTKNLAVGTVRYSLATVAKMGQQSVDLVTGKRIVSNDVINSIAGMKQNPGESSEQFELNKARLQFLLTEASTTLSLLLMKIMANLMFFPDDDERDEFNQAETGWEKVSKQPDVAAYFFLENILSGLANDVNILNDPVSASSNVLVGTASSSHEKWSNFLNSFGKQYQDGDYIRGENAGQNRILVQSKKMFVPKGWGDLSLGFYNMSRRDYNPKDPVNREFITDFKLMEAERQDQRSDRKIELKEQYKKDYPYWSDDKIEKRVQKRLHKEFPTIKKYFNDDGTLKEYKAHKVEQYNE
jgi:hypothetical protein